MSAAQPAAPASPPVSAVVRGVLLFSATLTIMAGATIAPSLPQMGKVFAEVPNSDVLVRLVLTITALAIALSAPLAGLFADRVGRRPLLIFSLALYAAAGVSGYFAPNLWLILAGRVLLGVGVAGVMTAGSALAADLFDGSRRAAFLGLQSAFTSFGGVLFLPLGGLLANLGWRDPFLVYLAALLILPFAVLAVREAARPAQPGAAQAGATGEPSGFRAALPVYLLGFISMVVFYMGPTQLPFYLQRFGISPSSVGLVIAVSTLMGAFAALGYARLRARLSFPALAAASLALLGVGWVVVGTAHGVAQVILGLIFGGLGSGLAIPNLSVWIAGLATPAGRGRLLGGLTTAIFLGQFLSPLLSQPLSKLLGLGAVFAWAGVLALLVGGALALRQSARRRVLAAG